MGSRRKISACLSDFQKSVRRLRRLEEDSRNRLSPSNRRPQSNTLSRLQLETILGSTFFSVFIAYENLIEEVFLLFVMGKKTSSGIASDSYLTPKDYHHASELIKASQDFLDWNSPDTVLKRSELYLKNGEPIKSVYTRNLTFLRNAKKIRNHYAHNSQSSKGPYVKVLRDELTVVPPKTPTIGEFFLMRVPNGQGDLFIHKYIDKLENIAIEICS